ncbi:MAG: hypothetical protein ACLQBX_15550 [Candidatus Limnocylindrales bacterium]
MAAAIAAVLVLWQLLPSEPVPVNRYPAGDRTSDRVPSDQTDLGT